ncbi:MAG: LPD38 domain-containing protein [Syntrophobacteraceae bacterium]
MPAASTVQQEAEPEKSSYQRLQETAVDDLASLRNSKEIGNSVIGLFGSEEEFNRIDEGELPVNKRWRLANRFAADLHTALVELDLQEADRILSRIKKALKPADFGDQEIRTVGDTPVLDSRPIEEREMQEAEDEKHRQWVKEQEEKQLKMALSRPYAMKSDSKSKSAVPKKSWRSVLGDVNLQSMQKDTGKGDITTGQTPQPEGGETLQSYLRTNTEKHPEGYRGWTSVTDMEPKWHNFGLDKRKHFFNPEEIRSGSAFEIFDFEEKKWFSFKSREEEEAFKEKYPYADLTQNPGDKERVWYRFGPPPESNKSRNYAENKVENGVSVYATPEGSGGAVFFSDREIYSGKGRQVDWGSDGEPVVIPTGKWRKYKPSSNRSTPRNTGGQNIPKEPPAPTSIPTSNVPSSKTETEYSWAVARRNTPVVPAVNVKTIELREEARRSQIIERVRKAFDIPLRQGRFREKALGIYKPGERVIRLKKANDVEVAIHEIGHDLQRLMKFPDKMPAEVRALAYQGAKSKNKEGFAEFVRLYVTNESEARNLAPSFYQAFETKLQERPDIRDAFVTARQAWEEYIAAPSVARVMSLIVSGKDQRKRRFPTFSELYTRLTDEINPLKVMRDAAAKKQGAPIPTARDPYMIAWLNRGWARKAEQFAKWGQFKMTDSGFEKTGPPLREILEPIERQGTRRLLDTYLVAKRAVNDPRIIKGFEGVLRGTDLQQTVTELEPLFSETADQLYKYSDNLFRYLVDSGRISEDAYQSAKKKNLFYAPLYRVIDVDTPARGLSKKRFGNVPNPIKRLKGSSRDIYSPTENILYNTYAMINAAERNQVGAAMIELSQIEGMGEFIEKLPPNLQPVKMDTDEALTILGRSLGIQGDSKAVFLKGLEDLGFTEDDLPELITTFRPNYNTKPNETIFYNKGKPEVYELAPDLYKAIVNTDPSVMHFAMNILAFPAKMLRAGATLTLEFAARNPIRDQFSAFIYSKYGYVPGYDLVKGIFHILKKDTLYQEFNASGAAHAALVSMDRNYLGKSLDDLLNSRGVKNIAKNIIFHPIEALRAFSELTEEATRVGEFERGVRSEMKARGLKPDLTNPFGTGASRTDLMKAGQAARDVTLDFSRVGTEVKSLNAIIAFFNATVQGADKMVRAFRDAPARTLLKTVLSITVPSILLWMAQKDDPYYQEIPGWRKTLFWNIVTHNDDGTVKNIWSIPKPFEIGILFGSFPEAVLDWIYKKDPQGMKKSAEGLWDSLTPGMWPTAAIPILEWWGNKSMFFDRPIVPRGRQDLKPSLQYGPRTAETWKLVAKGFEKVPGLEAVGNPAKLENLFRGYTGGLGAYGTQSVDKIIEALGQSKLPTKPAKGLEDYPGIRGFMWRFPSASTDSIERFYRKYERENTAWESKKDEAGIRGLSKFGVRLPKGSQPDELARLKSIADTMSTLRKMADLTYSNKNLTPEIKREMLDKYYLAMINAARVGLGRKPIEGVRK